MPRPALAPLHPGRRAARSSRRRSRPRPPRDCGYQVQPAQVLVTNGGKQALYNAFATLLDPGDEVLLPAPYWTTYPESIRLAGGVPGERSPPTSDAGTGSSLEQLEAALTPRTKLLVFVSPSNPTGAVYPPERGRGDRAVGGGARPVGGHRRDLRAPRVRRRAVRLDADARARAGRPLRRRQRGGQDVRHDRLAGGLDDRPGGRGQGRHQPAVARHLERRQRLPDRRPRRGERRPVRGRRDARGVRPAAARPSSACSTDRRRRLPGAGRRVLRLPLGHGGARARDRAGDGRAPPPSWPR